MGTGQAPQWDVARQMARARASFPFDFVITLGDNIYTGGDLSDFDRAFVAPYGPLLDAGVRFYASRGNHDHRAQLTYPHFNMHGDRYYAFTWNDVRFFALDSTRLDAAQIGWLEAQLRDAGGARWRVCFFHHPLYSSAKRHGSDARRRALLEPVFVKYGVDVVLSGHDHVYERTKPQQGITYFVEGASGQLRPGNLRPSAVTARGFDADRSFLLMEFAQDAVHYRAVSRAGETVDAGVIPRTTR
jgi:3',5'-cyclic AMP phosphodiesterase CpdA